MTDPSELDPMRMEQGLTIPCVDCVVLLGPRADCPVCGGAGEHFQPARMGDRSIQWERGRSDRERCEAARRGGEPEALAGAIRACFVSHTIWGPGWAAGFLGRTPDEDGGEEGWWEAAEQAWRALEPQLKAEFLAARGR